MITARPVTPADILRVLNHLSRRSKDEVRAFGFTPKQGNQWVRDAISRNGADAILADGVAIALIGTGLNNGNRETWFQGREEFFTPATVQFSRSYVRKLRQEYPGDRIISLSRSAHPETERWFKLLGFQKVEEQHEPPGPPFRVFELRER